MPELLLGHCDVVHFIVKECNLHKWWLKMLSEKPRREELEERCPTYILMPGVSSV